MQKEVVVAVADLHHLDPPPDLHPQGLAQAHAVAHQEAHQGPQDHQAVQCSGDPTTATTLESSLSLMDVVATITHTETHAPTDVQLLQSERIQDAEHTRSADLSSTGWLSFSS